MSRKDYICTGDFEVEFGVPVPGRILPQERWVETLLRLPPSGVLDWAEIFGRRAPVVLDLGCGNGRYLLGSALSRPDHDHFGIDEDAMVIRYARRRGNQRGLANLRFAVASAFVLLRDRVPAHSLAELHVYHPQPCHDSARAAERLLGPRFFALAHRALAPGGLFVVQTDTRAYWHYIRGVARFLFEIEERDDPWPDAPLGRTRREIMARREGLTIHRAQARPLPLSDEEAAAKAATLPPPEFVSERAPKRGTS